MNQIKIGKFITKCRKSKNMTQNELAKKLNVTNKAVSKWETGKGMPDSSIMLKLCEELGIKVDELLKGEFIQDENYERESKETIIKLLNQNEIKDKNLMLAMWTILISTSILYICSLILSINLLKEKSLLDIYIFVSTIIFLIANFIGLKLETNAGYYECKKCHHKFKPKYNEIFWAIHFGTDRYIKCPKCQKYNWSKKI